jgi:hypothetical protein
MSDSLFLTPGSHGQVAEMTGAHTRAGQLRNLRQNGIRHTVNAAGWPVVAISAVEGHKAKPEEGDAWRSRALDAA